nr:hypothetical protein [uncultured Methanobrevibacter sp.]
MIIPFPKDTLQKLSLISFAQAMLVMMGDTRRVVGFHPTELIIPTFRRKFMDAVLELDDGVLLNIEFLTGNLVEKFLLRCAQYAINLRVISGRYVETKILSTGSRSQSKSIAFISRIFHFRPEIYFYSEFDGLEKLINIKNKISNQEKLTLMDRYNLVFIPLMGNVDRVKAAFEVFNIANNSNLFTEDEQSEIKRCQYIVAQIIAEDDDELLEKFWEIIKMNNDFLVRYEQDLIDKNTQEVTEQVKKSIAKKLKDCLSDLEIAKRTGLSLEEVQQL